MGNPSECLWHTSVSLGSAFHCWMSQGPSSVRRRVILVTSARRTWEAPFPQWHPIWDGNNQKLVSQQPENRANDANDRFSGLLWVAPQTSNGSFTSWTYCWWPQSIVNERSWNTSMFPVALLIQERDRSHWFKNTMVFKKPDVCYRHTSLHLFVVNVLVIPPAFKDRTWDVHVDICNLESSDSVRKLFVLGHWI